LATTVYRHDQRLCEDCRLASLPRGPVRIQSDRDRVMDAITAYQLTSMMEGVVQRGTAAGDQPAGAGGGQDRHHERRQGRVVRRLYLEHRGGVLHRL
jgi:hypothetical protein